MLKTSALALSFLLATVACGDDDGDDNNNTTPDASVGTLPTSLTLSVDGLQDLGADYVYEGWVVVDGSPVSTGRFSSDGSASQSFDQDITVAAEPTAFILTIEPASGDVPAPADTHVVAGDIASNAATLSISHAAALGDDFSSAAGTFFLATPTSAEADDDNLGIWFFDPAGPTGLTLATLPAGWAYEGWVVDQAGPVSTGTFTDVAAGDSDGAGAASEMPPAMLPGFPGQDFITPPTDLTVGYTAVISIEPVPDNSPMPFQLKPLIQPIDPLLVGGANAQTFGNAISGNTITGSVTLQ